jgi:hypothetical protein
MKRIHLLFVYNANSDLFSSVTGFVHKIISPQTYDCSLCTLTYGNMHIKQEWKTFLERLPAKKIFLHKDEFIKKYNLSVDLPAVFYLKSDQPIVLISASEINSYITLNELTNVLLQRTQLLESSLA